MVTRKHIQAALQVTYVYTNVRTRFVYDAGAAAVRLLVKIHSICSRMYIT